MNDPMEGAYKGTLRTKQRPDWKPAVKALTNQKLQLGIACFSEPWDNELMWAHYADGFRGICVAYKLDLLQNALSDVCALTRVMYADSPRRLNNDDIQQVDMGARIVLSQKSSKWAYEREWRLFSKIVGKHKLQGEAVSHVYLGTRMPMKIQSMLTSRLAAIGIEARSTKLDGYRIVRSKKAN